MGLFNDRFSQSTYVEIVNYHYINQMNCLAARSEVLSLEEIETSFRSIGGLTGVSNE